MKLYNVKNDKNFNNEEAIMRARVGCEKSKEDIFLNNIPLIRKLANRWMIGASLEQKEELYAIGYRSQLPLIHINKIRM
ncbi:hypothetical protein JCM16418A_16390 [Paenibacillus pini]